MQSLKFIFFFFAVSFYSCGVKTSRYPLVKYMDNEYKIIDIGGSSRGGMFYIYIKDIKLKTPRPTALGILDCLVFDYKDFIIKSNNSSDFIIYDKEINTPFILIAI